MPNNAGEFKFENYSNDLEKSLKLFRCKIGNFKIAGDSSENDSPNPRTLTSSNQLEANADPVDNALTKKPGAVFWCTIQERLKVVLFTSFLALKKPHQSNDSPSVY